MNLDNFFYWEAEGVVILDPFMGLWTFMKRCTSFIPVLFFPANLAAQGLLFATVNLFLMSFVAKLIQGYFDRLLVEFYRDT